MTLTKEHTVISPFERNGDADYAYLNQISFSPMLFALVLKLLEWKVLSMQKIICYHRTIKCPNEDDICI